MRMPCKNCCFATYSDITQTGCSLGLIDKYRANGITVIEAYDEDKEFFVLEDKMCPFHRTDKWAADKKDPIAVVKEDVRVVADLFIHADKNTTIQEVLNTLESISQFQLKVHKAVVMLHNTEIKPSHIFDKLDDDFQYMGVPVQISAVLPSDITAEESIDHCVNTIESAWIGLVKAGITIKSDFLSKLNKLLFDDMYEFVMLEPTADYPVLIVQSYAFRYLGGSSECEMGPTPEEKQSYKGISNKMRAFAELSEKIHLIGVVE